MRSANPKRYRIVAGPDQGKVVFERDRICMRGVRHVLVRCDKRWPQGNFLVREDQLQLLPFVAGDRVEVLQESTGEVAEVLGSHLVVHIPTVADCQCISTVPAAKVRLLEAAA